MNFKRPSWDEYFMTISHLTSQRSNCIKRKVGCIIVKDNRILSLGYNGTPKGTLNCFEGGCKRCSEKNLSSASNLDLCMCLHAEENAMLFIQKSDINNSTMYVTLLPCIGCAKKIIQCGIKKIVFTDYYSQELDEITLAIFKENNIITINMSNIKK
jgi:dCMP deaminase